MVLSLASLPAAAGNFYAGISPATVPWPGGIVPYEFTNTLTAAQTNTYLNALREWELAANVQFVPHTTQANWILFTYNTNGFDHFSAGDSPQVVTVASLSRAQVCHEMGHSFGFNHENIRSDAANYIAVLTNHITDETTNLQWFIIDPTTVTNGPYDFESVMHLGWDFESTNPGVLATQQPKPPYFPRYQFRMGNYCISPGDRAALAYLYGPPAAPLTNVVTTTADFGAGSLRAAIYYATDHPGTTIQFDIPTGDAGYSNGVFNIHLTGMLPPLVANGTVIDGSTQPGFAGNPLIMVDASQILPETHTSDTFLIYSADNQIKNIAFSGFDWNGMTLIYADATNNTISGCWFGLDATGANAASNAYQGILITDGASRNIIGGTNALERNVISGNAQYGILISGSNTTGNVILGNYIGTDSSGSASAPNLVGGIGIFTNSSGETIGGTNAAARNVISGNGGAGILLSGAGVSNILVAGNYLGLQATGAAGVPNVAAEYNSTGVQVTAGANGNAILNNVISSNNIGVFLSDAGTANNVVQGNLIGTDSTGETAVGNIYEGIALQGGATSNLIGGTVNGAANVISANYYGLVVDGAGTSGNTIQGNLIGTDLSGATALPGVYEGLVLEAGASTNLIGGPIAGAANVISGNYYGLVISDLGTSGNVVEGNLIGTDVSGRFEVPGVYEGLAMGGGAAGNIIGGAIPGARNVISGNYFNVVVRDPGTSGNFFEGNFIGPDLTGTVALTNQYEGFALGNGASSNVIGGTVPGAGNVISGNYIGVFAGDPGTSGNVFEGNFIGTDSTGANALGNDYNNLEFAGGAGGNEVGGVAPGAGNTIAFAGFGSGVAVYDAATTNDAIRGNSIFSNGGGGIYLNGYTSHSGFLAGPNDLQNDPIITNAYGYANTTVMAGTLNSLPGGIYSIDFYRTPANDDEGQFYLGTAAVTTDGSGNALFSCTNTAGNYSGQYLTATATSAGGDTSEFSPDVQITNAPAPSAQFTGNSSWNSNGFSLSLNLQTNFNYRIEEATNLAAPVNWSVLTSVTATNSLFIFTDTTATNSGARFYRVISP